MKKAIKLVMTFIFLATTGCALVHRKDIPEAASTPQAAETTAPATETNSMPATESTTLKKSIVDRDVKKNQEDTELKKRVVILPFIDKQSVRDLTILKNLRAKIGS